MLEEVIHKTLTLTCDGPALGTQCPTLALQSTSDAGLLKIMTAQGWRLPDFDGDLKIDRKAACYCGPCDKALQSAGKLPPKGQ